MRYLLDTQVLLWALQDSKALGALARERLGLADIIFVSAGSLMDVQAKAAAGKLLVPDGFEEAVLASGFTELAVSFDHTARMSEIRLPNHSGFDRLLLAQALQEQLVFVTANQVILVQYPGLCLEAGR